MQFVVVVTGKLTLVSLLASTAEERYLGRREV